MRRAHLAEGANAQRLAQPIVGQEELGGLAVARLLLLLLLQVRRFAWAHTRHRAPFWGRLGWMTLLAAAGPRHRLGQRC